MRKQRRVPQIDIFPSREAYLEWVGEWRVDYKALSDLIRKQKTELHQPHNQSSPSLQSLLSENSMLANEMMLDRDEATVLARAHCISTAAHRRAEEARADRVEKARESA
jgi:hypothetical protein